MVVSWCIQLEYRRTAQPAGRSGAQAFIIGETFNGEPSWSALAITSSVRASVRSGALWAQWKGCDGIWLSGDGPGTFYVVEFDRHFRAKLEEKPKQPKPNWR